MKDLSEKQIGMIKHAYGFSSREPGYRSHYCTNKQDADMLDMVEKGYFHPASGAHSMSSDLDIFHVTEKSVRALESLAISKDSEGMNG